MMLALPPQQLHHVSCSVEGNVSFRDVRSLRKSSFYFHLLIAVRNICLDDATAVNEKEGVVGEVGLGVQHSKAATHLRLQGFFFPTSRQQSKSWSPRQSCLPA